MLPEGHCWVQTEEPWWWLPFSDQGHRYRDPFIRLGGWGTGYKTLLEICLKVISTFTATFNHHLIHILKEALWRGCDLLPLLLPYLGILERKLNPALLPVFPFWGLESQRNLPNVAWWSLHGCWKNSHVFVTSSQHVNFLWDLASWNILRGHILACLLPRAGMGEPPALRQRTQADLGTSCHDQYPLMAPPFSSFFLHIFLPDGMSHCVRLLFFCFLWLVKSIQITQMPGHGRWWVSSWESATESLTSFHLHLKKKTVQCSSEMLSTEMQRIRQCSVMTFFILKCLLIYPTIGHTKKYSIEVGPWFLLTAIPQPWCSGLCSSIASKYFCQKIIPGVFILWQYSWKI